MSSSTAEPITATFAIGDRVRRKSQSGTTYDHFYVDQPIRADRDYIVVGVPFVKVQRGGGGDPDQEWTCVPVVQIHTGRLTCDTARTVFADVADLEYAALGTTDCGGDLAAKLSSLALNIPEGAWKPNGEYLNDDRARLTTPITLAGTPMHLEAYAIDPNAKDGESVEQRVLCSDADRALGLIVGDGGFPVTTTMIGGREYVLIATPFGN